MLRECVMADCQKVHDCSGRCGVKCVGHFCDCVEV
jgi:hypothetical protein